MWTCIMAAGWIDGATSVFVYIPHIGIGIPLTV